MNIIINNKNKSTGECKELFKMDTANIISIQPVHYITSRLEIKLGIEIKDSLSNDHSFYEDSENQIILTFEDN